MDSNAIHDYARRFVGAHGDKAELEAARRAAECERQGETESSGRLAADSGRDQGNARPASELTDCCAFSSARMAGSACAPWFDADQTPCSF